MQDRANKKSREKEGAVNSFPPLIKIHQDFCLRKLLSCFCIVAILFLPMWVVEQNFLMDYVLTGQIYPSATQNSKATAHCVIMTEPYTNSSLKYIKTQKVTYILLLKSIQLLLRTSVTYSSYKNTLTIHANSLKTLFFKKKKKLT